MTHRLRVGVVGGGLIAQVKHLPNLEVLRDRFALVGLSDPSAAVRTALGERYGCPTFADAADLMAEPLDAVVIAAPDPWHFDLCAMALARNLHVFCEKPICYCTADVDRLIQARDRARRVVQVGYMKRCDAAVRAAMKQVAGRARDLRYLSVEVSDPDFWPFVEPDRLAAASDIPPALRDATLEKQRAQIAAALSHEATGSVRPGFAGAYCSSLVHDVNLAHGFLDALGLREVEPQAALFFAGGRGGHATLRLPEAEAMCSMVHFETPRLAAYRERIALYFDDSCVELLFQSPYLKHAPTQLIVHGSEGGRLRQVCARESYRDPFEVELEAFWTAIVEGAPAVNTLEEARRDQDLMIRLARLATKEG